MSRDKMIGVVLRPRCTNRLCCHNENKICKIMPGYSKGFICCDNTAENEVYFDSDRNGHVKRGVKTNESND